MVALEGLPACVGYQRHMNANATPDVLLVEDNILSARSIVRILAHAGHVVLWVQSCTEARHLLTANPAPTFAYALCDDHFADGSGLDLLPLLDALDPRPATVLYTAFISEHRLLAAFRAGRTLLAKPTTPAGLRELLSILDQKRTADPDRLGEPSAVHGEEHAFGAFALASQGMRTAEGFVALHVNSIAILRFLLVRSLRFTTGAEVARELLGRRDSAGAALARRRIADARRALGPHHWLIESVSKRGYRIDPRAFAPLPDTAT